MSQDGMGNPSNGPVAVVKIFALLVIMSLRVISGHIGHCVEALMVCVGVTFITPGLIWSQVVTLLTLITVEVKALRPQCNRELFKKSE